MQSSSKLVKRALGAAAAVAIGVAVSLSATGPSDAQSGDNIAARKALMKSNGGSLKALGEAVAAGDNAAATAAAQTINENASKIPSLFPEGSGTGETRAKPEIWQNFADFRAKANDLESASAKVVADAQAGNLGSDPKAVVGSIGKTCGACHEAYRAPKQE